jgi:hypothetical protein
LDSKLFPSLDILSELNSTRKCHPKRKLRPSLEYARRLGYLLVSVGSTNPREDDLQLLTTVRLKRRFQTATKLLVVRIAGYSPTCRGRRSIRLLGGCSSPSTRELRKASPHRQLGRLLSLLWMLRKLHGLRYDNVMDAASALNPAQISAGRRLPIHAPPPAPTHRRLAHCLCRLMPSGRLPTPSAPANSPAVTQRPS